MDGVSVASSIAGLVTLALQVGGTIAIYVNAIKERSKNIKELHDELLLLGEVLSGLRDFVNSEKAKGSSFDSHSVLSKAIRDCHQRIERIGDRLKPPPDNGRIARVIDQLKWPFEQREVMQMVENLRRFSQTFQFAYTIEGFNLLRKSSDDATKGLQEMLDVSKKISELSAQMGLSAEEASRRAAQLEQIIALVPVLSKTATDLNEISQATRLAELREQERRTTDILDWLAPVSSLHKHRDLQVRRAEGTGKWLLEHHSFRQWEDETTAEHDLLCVGGPGAGKSILCSQIIDHLRTRFKDEDVAVAYYYYDYSEQQSQHPLAFARSLCRQLSSHGQSVPTAVAEFYQKTRNAVKDQTWFHDLLAVMRRVIATFDHCYIVVDALDEADNSSRTGLFEVITAMRQSCSTLKVAATMRPHTSNLWNKFHNVITIDILADPGDLRLYLRKTINEHPESDDLMDEKLKEKVLDTLCDNANGMFLLPALHIRSILDQITKADVKRTLMHLSTNLTQAFQSTIQRISNLSTARKDLAFRTLMWISHTNRPLTVTELQHAMALRLDTDLDRDNFPSVRTLLDCCSGLVEVDYESSTIRLVHHSLEEYLREHDHGLFRDANLVIARTCLKYLMLNSLSGLPHEDRIGFSGALEHFAFLSYAAIEWGHHARSLPAEDIKDLALLVLANSSCLITMARVRDFDTADLRHWKPRAWSWAYSGPGGAGISVAAGFGLTQILEILIAQNRHSLRLNVRDAYGNTALHEATLSGQEKAAEMLLRHGASVLEVNYSQSTPIYLAVSYRRLPMVNLLLLYGREQLDVEGPKGFTPLHKAVEQGDEECVALLLQRGASVGAETRQGTTALHIAALRGYLSIAKLLVLAGAVVHVEDKEKLCPLDYAATGGFTELVGYLLDNGGRLFHKGRELWTPLHRSARGGHTDCVRFFLDRGVNVLLTDFKDNTPLHLAVRSGTMDTVKMLLEHSPDPELKRSQLFAKDRKGSTPREVAFYTAHYNIHKYLRATEWEVQGLKEPSNASLLTTAIEKGDLTAVQRHLSKHPDSLDALDEDGQPPLHVALQENQRPIVEHLLERGASIESVGYHGWRPLHIAASLGNLDFVELCLSHGARVDTRTHTLQTPLHKAASSHSLAVVRRLLSAGADPTAINDRGMTALHIAAHQNDTSIVRMLLLEYEMDIFARDRQGLTAAMWAERSAHMDIHAFLKAEEKASRTRRRSSTLTVPGATGKMPKSKSTESLALKDVGDALRGSISD